MPVAIVRYKEYYRDAHPLVDHLNGPSVIGQGGKSAVQVISYHVIVITGRDA
ncbi:MAG: hypothetical protein Q8K97_00215 [Pseudohongiella sp.]|nr:hypothetical protein [Pseudohongiella sp.]